MTNKITFITPPDIYENSNRSLLFVNLGEKNQELASKWLFNFEMPATNFYVFSGEPNITWLLHATGVSNAVFIDVDNLNDISKTICSYLLGKNHVYYMSNDENLAAIYGHLNTNRVSSIEQFLEKVFSE